jgi:hypothetical protein
MALFRLDEVRTNAARALPLPQIQTARRERAFRGRGFRLRLAPCSNHTGQGAPVSILNRTGEDNSSSSGQLRQAPWP